MSIFSDAVLSGLAGLSITLITLFPDTLNLRDIRGFHDCFSEDSHFRDYDTVAIGTFWWNFLIPCLQYVSAVLLLNFEDPIVVGNKLFRKYLIFTSQDGAISQRTSVFMLNICSLRPRGQSKRLSVSLTAIGTFLNSWFVYF